MYFTHRNRPVPQSLLNSLFLSNLRLLQHLHRLFWCDHVGDISKIDAPHQLLGCHIRDNAPDRLPQDFPPQIPHGVQNSRHSEVRNGLLRPYPSVL